MLTNVRVEETGKVGCGFDAQGTKKKVLSGGKNVRNALKISLPLGKERWISATCLRREKSFPKTVSPHLVHLQRDRADGTWEPS